MKRKVYKHKPLSDMCDRFVSHKIKMRKLRSNKMIFNFSKKTGIIKPINFPNYSSHFPFKCLPHGEKEEEASAGR